VLNKFKFLINHRVYVYVILAYVVLFYLLITTYKNLSFYEEKVKNTLLNESISLVDDTSSNLLKSILDEKSNFVLSNIKSEALRLKNEKLLSLMKSSDINSIFVLYRLEDNYFFLLDTDREDHAQLHEVFIPENTKLFAQVVQKKKKRVFIQKDIDAVSFTLVKPIIQQNRVVALLVIDYTENRLMSLLDISVKVLSYLSILFLIFLFLFLFYVIYTHYNKYRLYRNPQTNTLNRIYMVDHYDKIDFTKYYVALVDLDFFKRVNNRYGEKNGDKVITSIIKIMSKNLLRQDKFIQYSGEEFLLFIAKKSRSEEEARELFEGMRMAVNSTNFHIDKSEFNITISMGVLLDTTKERSLQEVIHKVDTALYEAKHHGRNRIVYYDMSHAKRLYREKLKEMIESDKLVCYYQPIRDLETGELYHYEALLRIEDGENIIFPDKILPDLENSYLYSSLTKKVIFYNLDKLRADEKMKIAINLSADDLVNDAILSILAQNSDLADRLLIEILENKSIDYKRVERSLQKLKLFGYKICIDDFGSGYSNLGHLLNLSIDYLKIDGSIVKEIYHDKKAYALVKAFATFCQQNNIEVIAEFVDKQKVVDILKSFGIKYGQGWYFSKAVPYEDLDKNHL